MVGVHVITVTEDTLVFFVAINVQDVFFGLQNLVRHMLMFFTPISWNIIPAFAVRDKLILDVVVVVFSW